MLGSRSLKRTSVRSSASRIRYGDFLARPYQWAFLLGTLRFAAAVQQPASRVRGSGAARMLAQPNGGYSVTPPPFALALDHRVRIMPARRQNHAFACRVLRELRDFAADAQFVQLMAHELKRRQPAQVVDADIAFANL